MVHAQIYHLFGDPELAGQNGDRRATTQEVVDHLGGDLAGIGTDPFGTDPVVRAQHEKDLDVDLWPLLAGDQRAAQGQLFQAAQAALRFGESVKTSLHAASQCRVKRLDATQGPFKSLHVYTIRLRENALTGRRPLWLIFPSHS